MLKYGLKNVYSKNSVCIFSYNSRGFSDKQDMCEILMTKNGNYFPMLCNQDNFILHGNRFKIKQSLPNARIYFKKAVMDSMDGRPKNGMFIAVPDEINVSSNHWRVQAITLQAPSNRLLIINSYFPNDPKSSEFDTSQLLTTLSAISSVMGGGGGGIVLARNLVVRWTTIKYRASPNYETDEKYLPSTYSEK